MTDLRSRLEARARAVFDTAADGLVLTDARGSVILVNPACERMFGYGAAEIAGRTIRSLLPAVRREGPDLELDHFTRAAAAEAGQVEREAIGLRKNGETFPLDLSVAQGMVEGAPFYVGVLRDATDRRRAEDEREALLQRLTAANDERARFARAAAHDLRAPLQTVAAFCAKVLRDYSERLDDRGREYLSLASGAAMQMGRLLDDLVEFDQHGWDTPEGAWFSAGESLERVLRNLTDSIETSGARVTHGPLPMLFGNPVRFDRLLQNLIDNALKYVEPDAQPRVEVTASREGAHWRIDVADNGVGIPERHLGRVFEPFKRLHPQSRYPGSGLGLAICRRIVEDFGGEISVRSTEGQGSMFSFTIRSTDKESDHADPGP